MSVDAGLLDAGFELESSLGRKKLRHIVRDQVTERKKYGIFYTNLAYTD